MCAIEPDLKSYVHVPHANFTQIAWHKRHACFLSTSPPQLNMGRRAIMCILRACWPKRARVYTFLSLATSKQQMANPSHQSRALMQSLPDFGELTISAPLAGKTSNATHISMVLNDTPIRLVVGSTEKPAHAPFEIKRFNETDNSTKLNLHLTRTDPTCEQYRSDLDNHRLKSVAAYPTDCVGNELPVEHSIMMYKPVLQQHGAYCSSIKGKTTWRRHAN